jgi:hypothetical protein
VVCPLHLLLLALCSSVCCGLNVRKCLCATTAAAAAGQALCLVQCRGAEQFGLPVPTLPQLLLRARMFVVQRGVGCCWVLLCYLS